MQLSPGRFKRLLTAALLALPLVALPCLCLYAAEARGAGAEGFAMLANPRPAPDLSLSDLNGETRSLEDFRGSTVLLHFWASWCEPCREEFPALKDLWKSLGGEDFVILAVAEDSAERIRPYVEEHGVEFPVLIDQYGGVMRAYGVSVIPVSVVIDRDGMIRAVLVGPRDYSSAEARKFLGDLSGKPARNIPAKK